MPQFAIEYYAGTYEGTRTVTADDDEHAIAQVKSWLRRQMIGMYADGYKVIDFKEDEN